MIDRDEDDLLRSVAVQNATSIFRARQRADEELLRTKEELERKTRALADSLALLRRSEQELADFFENASVGLHWVGSDGAILRVNQAELDMLGYRREEYVGRPIAEFHADADVIADILRRLTAGETLRDYPARLRCKDGSIRHVLIDSSVLWQDGTFIHTRCFTRDITDRRRAAELQARLAAIVESSEDAIVGKTLDSIIQTWNAGAERLFGYTAREAIGQSVVMLIPPERQDEERLILDRIRRGERLEHFDTVRLTKDGRRIDVSLTISPVLDAANRVVGASKIARDITTRKRAEEAQASLHEQLAQELRERTRTQEALRDSERRFRRLAETIPSIVWTAAPDGGITYANGRFYEYCGLAPKQSLQDWPGRVLHPDDRQRCVAAWHLALQQGADYEIEVRLRRHDGAYRWFVARAVPDRDRTGRIVQWFGTSSDIDDRKRAEHMFRFLADASATLAELTDYRSTLQRVASLAVPAFADWCAIDVREPDGSIRRLAVTHADPAKVRLAHELLERYPPRPADAHGLMKVLRTGVAEWAATIPDAVLQASARDEEHRRLIQQLGLKSYICMPLRSRGKTIGALSFVTAESGRVYDANDVAAAEDLAHRAVIAIENANLLATLQESDRRKDEFLAMLAHELRNPLAPIRNASQIFRVKAPPQPDLRWANDVIDRQVHQMTRLVDDLLDVSRISRGKIELRKERTLLASVVNSAVEASRPLIEKWGHELTVTMPPEPILLDVDVTRLAQVLLNLLNNAAKYTDQGGQIWLTVEAQHHEVVITVKDAGIGIPPHMLARIFDMFTQVDHAIERSEGGLGIGLTLVKRLVDMHGGTVEARSEGPGKGSAFLVRLPITESSKMPLDGPAGRLGEMLRATGHRILVVDDNRDAADSLGMLLRTLGNQVQTAYDGLQAVGAAAAFQPDVVLLDIGLPKLNGYEAARRIRAQEGGSAMMLIALTGWGQEDDRRRSREAGFDHHMTKPVEFTALEKLLAAVKPTAGRPWA